MVCLTRSLVAWILIAGTLFVASTIIRHITSMAGFPFARPHGQNYRMKFDIHSYSYQQQSTPPTFSNVSLDVISNIYVISLPRRTDRHLQMDRLKDVLHMNWTYKDAYDANASVVTHILRHVHALRSLWVPQPQPSDVRLQHGRIVATFDWPHDLEGGIYSQETLQSSGADLWTLPSSHSLSDLAVPVETADPYSFAHSEASSVSDSTSLACASGNNVFATFSPNLPLYKRLTAAKVACWYSHFQVIRGIANGGDQAVLVLEDDVDIERDLKKRLRPLWDALPNDWDIVYLGTSTISQALQ
jgi:Glycosyltransferase family 25 (LPS biosynthesis protein)